MSNEYSPDDVDERGSQKKSSQQRLLLLLLLLILLFAYLYFFTGLIKPREEKAAAPPPAQESVVKNPIPPRPEQAAAPAAPGAAPTGGAQAKPEQPAAPAAKTAAPAQPAPAAPAAKAAPPAPAKPAPAPAKEARPAAPAKGAAKQAKAPAAVKEAKPAAAATADKGAKPQAAKAKPAAKPAAGAYAIEINGDLAESEMGSVSKKLKQAGIANVVKVKSQKGETMHRLYLADFGDRDEAVEQLNRLKGIAPTAFMLNENGRYAVYAGSFLREGKAAVEQDRLYDKGVKLLLKKATIPVAVYKVRAGSFPDKAAADKAAAKLKNSGLTAKVVKAGK